MISGLADVAKGVRADLLDIYWILLTPIVCFLIIREFVKEGNEPPQGGLILKRVVISIILLMSFTQVANTIASVGDGIISGIGNVENLKEVLDRFGPKPSSLSNKWFNVRENILYGFSLIAYIIAYLGFFVTEALTHFIWVILYSLSPLMILCYVSPHTANITKNLYKGLVQVVFYKIMWCLLGALLLRIAKETSFEGTTDWVLVIVINFCIGMSMLLIPIVAKAFIDDGLSSAASAIASTQTMGIVTKAAGLLSSRSPLRNAANFISSPGRKVALRATNWARSTTGTDSANLSRFKNWYSQIGGGQESQSFKSKESRSSNSKKSSPSKDQYFRAKDQYSSKNYGKTKKNLSSNQEKPLKKSSAENSSKKYSQKSSKNLNKSRKNADFSLATQPMKNRTSQSLEQNQDSSLNKKSFQKKPLKQRNLDKPSKKVPLGDSPSKKKNSKSRPMISKKDPS